MAKGDDIAWSAFFGDDGSVMHGGKGRVSGNRVGRGGRGMQSPAEVRKIKAQLKAERTAAKKLAKTKVKARHAKT